LRCALRAVSIEEPAKSSDAEAAVDLNAKDAGFVFRALDTLLAVVRYVAWAEIMN
jgi:hypothetical protein